MEQKKRIALVSQDNRKQYLDDRVEYNTVKPGKHKIICTGTAGKLPATCNRSTTDSLIPLYLFNAAYEQTKGYHTYNNREVKL